MVDQPDITIVSSKSVEANDKGLDIHIKEENFRKQLKDARELFSVIQDELDHREEEDLKDGLSFLDMKNDTLLSYMIDVCNIVLRKVRGQSIEGLGSVERCVEYRVILDKIKTIDQRLSYQLNKLITLPAEITEEEEAGGVKLQNLDVDLESDEDEEDEGSDKSSEGSEEDDDDDDDDDDERAPKKKEKKIPEKVGVYRPPKLKSVAYKEDQEEPRRRGRDDRFEDDFSEKERTRYEEDNYTRLPDPVKKEKRKRKMLKGGNKGKGKKRIKSRGNI